MLWISSATLLVCIIPTCVYSHSPRISSSVKSPVTLATERRQSLPRSKIKKFQTMVPFYLQSHPMTASAASTDHHYQWWDTGSNPELVQSGWYGFNQFVPRSARNMGSGSKRKARTAYFLGESTHINAQTSFNAPSRHQSNFEIPSGHQPIYETPTRHQPKFETASRHQTKPYDEDYIIHETLRELQRNIHPLPQQNGYLEPQIVMINEAFGLPPGILVPVSPHHHQQNNFQQQQNNFQQQQNNYHSHQKDIRRLASAPSPVTIKVVPLKITSMDIANALKMMPFMPIPLDLLQNDGGNERHDEMGYDKEPSEDESDLPPPSSHVATPLDKPLGITYAEAQRTEHYISKYQPRK